jgi:hypothetical protein
VRVASLACALGLLAPAGASAHSLVRVYHGEVSYLSADAVSINDLTIEVKGSEIHIRDPSVYGGIDPGSCRPGETTPAEGWIIEVFCPLAGTSLVRVDLGEREDKGTVSLPIPTAMLGGGGADTLTGGEPDDVLVANDGNDTVTGGGGADEIDGGEGDDVLVAGAGNDTVDAGPGADRVDAGPGDDEVHARDGVADQISCGDGTDTVEADTLDKIAPDCENAARVAVAPPKESGPVSGDKRPPRVVVDAARRQRLGRRGTVYIAASASEPGFLSASGFLDVDGLSLPLKTDRRRVRRAGAGVELAVRFSKLQIRQIRRALRHRRPVVVKMAVVGTDLAGNSAQVNAPAIRPH